MNKTQHYFFFGLLLLAIGLSVAIFLPYLSALIIALVFSVIFRPIHSLIQRIIAPKNERSSLAALVSVVFILVAILTPLGFLIMRISTEAQDVYFYLTNEENQSRLVTSANDMILTVSYKVLGYYPNISEDSLNVAKYAQNLLSWSFTNIDSIVSNTAKFLFNIFIILFALYYMLRDGGSLKRNIIGLSPLLDIYDEEIFDKLETAIFSVVRGSLGVSIVQGGMTALGFWIFGVPNPILWGGIASIASLIPGIGTALVLIPAVVYLYTTGMPVNSIGLLIWSVLAVGLVDNFLGPLLIQKGVNIHEFLILLSVIGGLSMFGAIGFVLGPIILSFLFALLEIYKTHAKEI